MINSKGKLQQRLESENKMKVDEKNLIDLLKSAKEFSIPPFQRRYEWGKEQCQILFGDISRTASNDKGHTHYFGSFIVHSDNPANSEEPYRILDGQQRIMSSMLFLAACRHSQHFSDRLKKEIKEIIFIKNDKTRLQQQNDLDQKIYEEIMRDEKGSGEKSPLSTNYNYFCEKIEEFYQKEGDLNCLYEKGLKNFHALFLEFNQSDEDLQEVFESINSTGKPLSLSDLVHNYLLMKLDDDQQRNCIRDCWKPIETKLFDEQHSRSIIPEFIHDYMQSTEYKGEYRCYCKPSASKNQELYYYFKDIFPIKDSEESTKNIKNLKMAADKYEEIYFPERNLLPEGTLKKNVLKIKQILLDLKVIEATTAYSFLLALLLNEKFSPDDIASILEPIEYYFLRRRICGLSGSENKEFPPLTKEIARLANEKDKGQAMYGILCRLKNSARFPDDDEFEHHLREENFYKSSKKEKLFRLLYQLICKEISGNRPIKQSRNDLQIEHIMPRKLNPEWKEKLGKEAQDTSRRWGNNIGNLTLTNENQKLSNSSFEEKVEIYRKELRMAPSDPVLSCDHWDCTTIKERQDWIVRQALKAVPKESVQNCSSQDSNSYEGKPSLADLVNKGRLQPGQLITATSKKGTSVNGILNPDGTITINGKRYSSLSGAFKTVAPILGVSSNANGWAKWKIEDGRTLGKIRESYKD
ncbi:MAG: DUF262 domain-containing protein [Aeriscardovia sp.]|nr:DUF262 domain-containing protein [Aeriscardovia sp.]